MWIKTKYTWEMYIFGHINDRIYVFLMIHCITVGEIFFGHTYLEYFPHNELCCGGGVGFSLNALHMLLFFQGSVDLLE